jgi:hypothetical protein
MHLLKGFRGMMLERGSEPVRSCISGMCWHKHGLLLAAAREEMPFLNIDSAEDMTTNA